MSSTPTAALPTTIEATDQNSGARIVWNIEGVYPLSPAVLASGQTPWTHYLAVKRPAGKKLYTVFATIDADGKVVRSSRAVRLPW